ncbi:MAG: tRNA (adenosine(37)-N6)-threonylcarbamoyltransferase complex ATPase subunit type 1 TsaE [Acidobacteria bacterium]|nr:tRNA (adenosine(37)-N6)-threonylcarbamoyltransferase complex ATPase subunit type 1 TsaE [Acidobacteriota bacterium]TDI50690.1 MAG: tRNA (adenosine(37)-N6)-threonylcarbamoyltransferase complex ATPase subunit type 1 TsaE [Acidobacteriota bacterium]TDI57560.1 MAG: tRNA (adenosine(37)-N6)-threonylcarbamoyltransferase complex ATPase subunit type 1 TsaE [Acidobacteriota bacterium]
MIEVRCQTEDDTRAFASRLASVLRPGDTLVLAGGLGVGKTLFTGGLATGLGVEETVVSPSFVLVRRYDSGFLPFVHVDVYRLGSLNEFDDLDVFEMSEGGVLVIEWGDAVESALPTNHLRVEFSVEEDEARVLRLIPSGDWVGRDLAGVA